MEYFKAIFFISLILIIGKVIVLRKYKNVKATIIFVTVFTVFSIIMNILTLPDVPEMKNVRIVQSIGLVVLSLVLVVIDYFRYKNKTKAELDHQKRNKKYLSFRFYILSSLMLLIIDIILVSLIFIISFEGKFDSWYIGNIIVLVVLVIWNIMIISYKIKNKFKKQEIFIVTNKGYIRHELNNKYFYDLKDYINSPNYVITRKINGIIDEYGNRNFIVIFYIDNYQLPKDNIFMPEIHQLLLGWSSSFIQIKVDKQKK